MSAVFQSIPQAFQDADQSIAYIKFSIAFAAAVFLTLCPICRSQGSFFSLGAARKVITIIRICIIIELFALLPLIYCVIELGGPLKLHSITQYGSKGDSWLYGWGRPVLGLVVVGVGAIGDMHIYPRVICILGCCQQIVMDGLSEFQIRNYYTQVLHKGAPTGLYTSSMLYAYYWRDLISVFLCFLILLEMCYFSCIVGWGTIPYLSYSIISGGELDRCSAMRIQRERRRVIEMSQEQELSRMSSKRAWARKTRFQDEIIEKQRNQKLNVDAIENLQREYGGGEEVEVAVDPMSGHVHHHV